MKTILSEILNKISESSIKFDKIIYDEFIGIGHNPRYGYVYRYTVKPGITVNFMDEAATSTSLEEKGCFTWIEVKDKEFHYMVNPKNEQEARQIAEYAVEQLSRGVPAESLNNFELVE